MKIPTLTDRDLERLLTDARDPVAVLFAGSNDPEESERFWKQFKLAAEEWAGRVTFVRIDCEENPSALRQWIEIFSAPEIVIFRAAKPKCRINYHFKAVDLVGALERIEKAG